ncbi:small capsid protein [Psittacid alphaherpesvirus 5]|uniref:Small capsid protein n=1 Tax=Psittacid alphaherpesvirus 5 TaxID=2972693 RepID=A0A5P9JNZ5_9ALPH|nr:small capsid protein [Psittacid alphaherpesvirus 5]QFU14572.1 small capsid protein [Psittacid alphaherpesvirus 5]UOO01043.1 small capsid protein [Psittacid alphaherpesvirus 5]
MSTRHRTADKGNPSSNPPEEHHVNPENLPLPDSPPSARKTRTGGPPSTRGSVSPSRIGSDEITRDRIQRVRAFLQGPPSDRTAEITALLSEIDLATLIGVSRILFTEIPRDDAVRHFNLRTNIAYALGASSQAARMQNALIVRPVFARLGGPQTLWAFGVRQFYNPNPRHVTMVNTF